MEFNELPLSWRRKIKDLRSENAEYRLERNELRAELAALKAELGR
jgi:cell division protein FtsB